MQVYLFEKNAILAIMKDSPHHLAPIQKIAIGICIVVFALIGWLAWYSKTQLNTLNARISDISIQILTLENRVSSTTAELKDTIARTQSALEEQQSDVGSISKKLTTYRKEVGSITGTVQTLEKLSKTDPELLQKYSKVFFLNEHYAPPRLVEIPSQYTYSNTKKLGIHAEVWPHLEALLTDASSAKLPLFVSSSFRSFNEQTALKGSYTVTYGAGTANQFSADQGYSEHQLGTTVDFISSGQNGALDGFEKTPSYTWLKANAYKYGFVISYPENNAFYVFEPWHWRFVGVKLATFIHKENVHFYDLEQRVIDSYLADIFE
jgi:LAS superfamily LD-carboxypeptidase LdcB